MLNKIETTMSQIGAIDEAILENSLTMRMDDKIHGLFNIHGHQQQLIFISS